MSAPSPSLFARIAPLQASASLVLLAGGLHFTLTPVHGRELGFSETALGLIGAAYYAGFLTGAVLNAYAFRALGHRRLFAIYAVLTASLVAGQTLLTGVAAWMALRAGIGVAVAGLFAAIESWLNAVAPNTQRGRILSIYVTINQTALIGSQYLFTVFPAGGVMGFYVSAAILLTTILPISAAQGHPPPPPTRLGHHGLRALAQSSPVAFAGFAANGLATAPFWTLGPPFAAEQGLDRFGIGLFMSLPLAGSLLTQWPLGRLSDHMDRRSVIWPVAAAACLASLLVALAPFLGGHVVMYAGAILFGATALVVGTLASAHMNDRVPHERLTEAAAASFLVYGGASVIGPLIASRLMAWLGADGLFFNAAMIYALFALFTLWRMRVRHA